MAIDRDELLALLRENLSVSVDFSSHSYDGNNNLRVKLMLGDDVISETSTTVDPTDDRNAW